METINILDVEKVAQGEFEKIINRLDELCNNDEFLKDKVIFKKDESFFKFSMLGFFVIHLGDLEIKNTHLESEIKKQLNL